MPKNIEILFENDDFLAINKPAGLVVHSDGKTVEPSVCDWVLEKYPEVKGVGEPSRLPDGSMVDRPGIVHRLDRDTSGVLLIVKNQPTFEFFKDLFKRHVIQKRYNTIVWGEVKLDKGKIDRPIGRSKSDFRKWSAERFARGELREALTEYEVAKRIDLTDDSERAQHGHSFKNNPEFIPKFTFLDVYPKTGRTHQIRVHFKAINHPVVGDGLYAPNHPKALGFERLALHARSVDFTAPSGDRVLIEAPLPADFEAALLNI
ncbi:MAG TPA: RluA family pseudouridine synthase [Candidatus Paceibacterota bacterium]